MKKNILFILFSIWISILNAQEIAPVLMQKVWRANWITVPDRSPTEYGVYRFRKVIELEEQPESYIVHVSGDNKYKLFVNEQLVSSGPAHGDLHHWFFETIDIGPYLKKGKNIIASLVWNEGELKGAVQISYATAFILQGNTRSEYDINTNTNWKCSVDPGYSPIKQNVYGFYVVGPGERVDMNLTSLDWLSVDFNDDLWTKAKSMGAGVYKGVYSTVSNPWMLLPVALPQMEMKLERLVKTRSANGITVPVSFPASKIEFTIPADTTVSILLDQTYLTNAYPTLIFSKGKDAAIELKYAEALFENIGGRKGNRNEVEGKTFVGPCDSIISNGENQQNFTSLSWRTYRYMRLNITTKKEPLTINDLYGTFTAYPFQLNASFDSNDPLLKNIFNIGWRTARLCAMDTYMDCPFYERLQYIGDTRIQAMVTYFNSGDDRLARNAINLLDYSRLYDGVTQSCYPAYGDNIIPPFALLWVGMVSDYFNYRPDIDFVKSHLPGVRHVLSFFEKYQQTDGSLKNLPYWNFTDWVENNRKWKLGVPPIGDNGSSSILDLQLAMAFRLASQMERGLGYSQLADDYNRRAERIKQSVKASYWDKEKGLFADNADKDSYSQHANVLAILSETVTGDEATDICEKILTDTTLAPASIYFCYYLNQAIVKAGLGDRYLEHLGIWKKNIELGMTTWGETSYVEGTRSDCHAWGSSPNIEFFRTVLGIDSDAPGFSKVKIEPHLGNLTNCKGTMPHPNGKISVSYTLKMKKWLVEIILPENTKGKFVWKSNEYKLLEGENRFNLK